MEEVDNDPWELRYKIVTKKLGIAAPSAMLDSGQMKHIVDTLFPSHPPCARDETEENILRYALSKEELKIAVAALRNGKAPGPNGIPAQALKQAFQASPELLLRM